MQLNYKASNIARAEQYYSKNFFEVISAIGDSTPSMVNTIFILQAGGLTEEEASDAIDNQGIAGAFKLVIEGLMESGFLGKGQEAQEAKKTAKQALKSLDEASRSTGEVTKA